MQHACLHGSLDCLCWPFGFRQDSRSNTANLRLRSGRFEHCVANMYFLPLAWVLVEAGKTPADFDASLITIGGIVHNLVPVTLGNIVGGAGFVGVVYWLIYKKGLGSGPNKP